MGDTSTDVALSHLFGPIQSVPDRTRASATSHRKYWGVRLIDVERHSKYVA